MKELKNVLFGTIIMILLMICPLHADYDSYLAVVTDEVETEFANYKGETVNLQFNPQDYRIAGDFSNVENFYLIENYLDEKSKALLLKNSFTVIETQIQDEYKKRMYTIYERYKSNQIPLFHK